MAGNSVIGALRVDLGLNSAQFTAGLKTAQSGLAAFGKAAAIGLAAVATAAIAAGAAMGVAVKGAIDHADALSKSAQKAGVTVEALSRLEYAAKLSDVSLEDLTGSLGKLSKSMADAAANSKGTTATAFSALGISVKDASGKLRDGNAVFSDVADRFSRMEDGATKTSLAMAIFGKSGAALIPLLNGGAAGLKQMADESDRVGNTISGKTAAAAEKFNDTLTRVGQIMEGVVNQVMAAALPALQSLADTLASPQFASAAKQLATWIVQAMNAVVQAVVGATNAIGDLLAKITGPAGAGGMGASTSSIQKQISDWQAFGALRPGNQDRANNEITALQSLLPKSTWSGSTGSGTWGNMGSSGSSNSMISLPSIDISAPKKSLKDWNDAVDGTIARNQELSKSIGDGLTSAVQDFVGAIMKGTNPLQAFGDELANIGQQLLNGGIQSLISSIFNPNFIGGTLGAPALKLGFQSGIPGFASGTMSAPPGLAWVGENGPELVNFGGGESVASHSASMRALGGGSPSVVRVELGPGLVGSILQQASDNSVQIVKSGSPAAVATANRNKTS